MSCTQLAKLRDKLRSLEAGDPCGAAPDEEKRQRGATERDENIERAALRFPLPADRLDEWEAELSVREADVSREWASMDRRMRSVEDRIKQHARTREKLEADLIDLNFAPNMLSHVALPEQYVAKDVADTNTETGCRVWHHARDSPTVNARKQRHFRLTKQDDNLRCRERILRSLPLRELALARNEHRLSIIASEITKLRSTLSELHRVSSHHALVAADEESHRKKYSAQRIKLLASSAELAANEQKLRHRERHLFSMGASAALSPSAVARLLPLFEEPSVTDGQPVIASDDKMNLLCQHVDHCSVVDVIQIYTARIQALHASREALQTRTVHWKDLIQRQLGIETDVSLRQQALASSEYKLLERKG
ncbi:hypothetical protein DIPPA_22894 [Diplonema papillatum]|nr:hypothetical protein DIPPA_22894 [Diplonema papillatum]